MDPKTNQIPAEVRAFLESILEDAGMQMPDPQMKEEMIKELFVRLDNFMLTTIVEGLPPEKLGEFTKMAENKADRVTLENYLKQHIPNAQDVFTRSMLEFRDMYLGNVAAAQKAQPAPTTQNSEPVSEEQKS